MAMLSQQLQNIIFKGKILERKTNKNSKRFSYCTAIAIDSPSPPLSDGLARIRWGWSKLQGPRSEMEDDIVLKSENLDGFTFAAVFDGHAGFSSVEFLRDQLYKECMTTLKGGSLLKEKDFNVIKEALHKAFADADTKLMSWLEETGRETDSGATATVMFIGNDAIIVSHVGDSCVVLSRSGKAEALTWAHRPYGSNKVSLDEIRRIREAGGWIVNGRICGDISVSRAFGDMQFKTKKNEMLERGIKEGRWSRKFVSRIQFSGDLVTSSPDIYQTPLGSDVEFIILASDGLWDYISSKDAVSFVRNQLRQHGDIQIACDALARAALDQKSQDNISIVIADTGRTDWKSVPQEQQNVAVELIQALATMGIVSLGIWITSFL